MNARPVTSFCICTALCLASLTNCQPAPEPAGFIRFVLGEAFLIRDAAETPATANQLLEETDRLRTAEDSALEMQLRNIGALRLAENSEASISELSGKERIEIEVRKGRAGFFIDRMRPDSELRIVGPTLTASVRGTRFLFQNSDGAAQLALFDGVIRMRDNGGRELDLDQPGEIRLAPDQPLNADAIGPISPESQRYMAELEALGRFPSAPPPGENTLPAPVEPAPPSVPAAQ